MSNILQSVISLFPTKPKVAVLMSGSGSNAETLLRTDEIRKAYDISLIFTDNSESNAAKIAQRYGIQLLERHVSKFVNQEEREAYFEQLLTEMGALGIQAAIYAGFMKIVSRAFSEGIPGVNVHPADLAIRDIETGIAKYRGMNALPKMRRELGYVASTLHIVDTPVDSGSAIAVSSPLACQSDWSDQECHERLKAHEHRLYPTGLLLLAEGGVELNRLPILINTEA